MTPAIRYFRTAAAFRAWLERHGESARELWVGFWKKGSGRPSVTYPEALDEALCFGWIDGVRRSVDAERYTIRFTPRTSASYWSVVNIRRAEVLKARGRMSTAGLAAFDQRARKPARYSFENRPERLDTALARTFRAAKDAWAFFQAQPPGYRRTAIWYVMSAVKPATRVKRLQGLIGDSAKGRRLGIVSGKARS